MAELKEEVLVENQFKLLNDPIVKNHPQFDLITKVAEKLQERFPFGAFNRVDNVQQKQVPAEEFQSYFNLVAAMTFMDFLNTSADEIANLCQTAVFANCAFYSQYAHGFIKLNYPETDAMIINWNNPSHSAILIRGSKDDGLVVDFWADNSFLLSELPNNKPAHIESNRAVVHGVMLTIEQDKRHYLQGKPKVLDDLQLYRECYNQFSAWVAMHERRKELPRFSAPRTPVPIPLSPLDPVLISAQLDLISHCRGWTFDQKKQTAQIQCVDRGQAERILCSLNFSNAVVARIRENMYDNTFSVQCTHFDCGQLTKLAQSMNRFLENARKKTPLFFNHPEPSPSFSVPRS
jgi:hypothetical protein